MDTSIDEKATAFRLLHERPDGFIIPNPWDAGTARILAGLGFQALATTSGGLAYSLGRRDAQAMVTRGGAAARQGHRPGDAAAGLRRSRERLWRRSRGRRRDDPEGWRGRPGRRLDRGRHDTA
jgi:Phosphoenolpyruvate phosphomutase